MNELFNQLVKLSKEFKNTSCNDIGIICDNCPFNKVITKEAQGNITEEEHTLCSILSSISNNQ